MNMNVYDMIRRAQQAQFDGEGCIEVSGPVHGYLSADDEHVSLKRADDGRWLTAEGEWVERARDEEGQAVIDPPEIPIEVFDEVTGLNRVAVRCGATRASRCRTCATMHRRCVARVGRSGWIDRRLTGATS